MLPVRSLLPSPGWSLQELYYRVGPSQYYYYNYLLLLLAASGLTAVRTRDPPQLLGPSKPHHHKAFNRHGSLTIGGLCALFYIY